MKPNVASVSGFSTMAEILAEVFPALVASADGLSPAERAEILRQFHEQTTAPTATEEGSS